MNLMNRKSTSIVTILALASLLAAVPHAGASAPSLETKLSPADTTLFQNFGWSVAVSGDSMVAGTPVDSTDSTYAGAAYVFVRNGGTWSQQARLAPDVPSAFAEFGYAAAISGDTLVVGAPGEDAGGNAAGAVYVFGRHGTTWSQQATLTPSDPADDKNFGASVAIDGETIVVGALQDSDQGPDAGAAYVFVRSGTSWSQQTKLTADNFSPGNLFGFSVAISSGTVAVGSPYDDDAGLNAGAVYIFTRSGTIWSEQTELFGNTAANDDRLGWSVALDGDTVVAGAPRNLYFADVPGSAHVFVRSGTTWNEQARLVASDGAATDGFGVAVGFKGNTAVIGSRFDSSFAAGGGSIYLFTRSGTAWNQTAELASNDIGAYYQFGYSIGIDGPTIVVGAPLAGDPNAGEYQNGAAYVFASASNTAPVANPQSVTTVEDTAVGITFSGGGGPAAPLAFALVSGPPTRPLRVPLPTLTYTPNANANGADSFTFKVNDGELDSAPATVSIAIVPVNDAPTISKIANQTIARNSSTGPIAFTVGDMDNNPGSLTVSATSSNPTLVPDCNIRFGGSGANRTVTVTPTRRKVGVATITVTVSDGLATVSTSFTITVTRSNHPSDDDEDDRDLEVNSPRRMRPGKSPTR